MRWKPYHCACTQRPASPGRSWRRRPCGALETLPLCLYTEARKSWEELEEEALRCAGNPTVVLVHRGPQVLGGVEEEALRYALH